LYEFLLFDARELWELIESAGELANVIWLLIRRWLFMFSGHVLANLL